VRSKESNWVNCGIYAPIKSRVVEAKKRMKEKKLKQLVRRTKQNWGVLTTGDEEMGALFKEDGARQKHHQNARERGNTTGKRKKNRLRLTRRQYRSPQERTRLPSSCAKEGIRNEKQETVMGKKGGEKRGRRNSPS